MEQLRNNLGDQDYNSAFVEHRHIGRHVDIRLFHL